MFIKVRVLRSAVWKRSEKWWPSTSEAVAVGPCCAGQRCEKCWLQVGVCEMTACVCTKRWCTGWSPGHDSLPKAEPKPVSSCPKLHWNSTEEHFWTARSDVGTSVEGTKMRWEKGSLSTPEHFFLWLKRNGAVPGRHKHRLDAWERVVLVAGLLQSPTAAS